MAVEEGIENMAVIEGMVPPEVILNNTLVKIPPETIFEKNTVVKNSSDVLKNPPDGVIKFNTIVKLLNIPKALGINGRWAYIRGYDKTKRRYQVACGVHTLRSVMKCNLEVVRQPEDDHHPGDTVEITGIKSDPSLN